MKRLPRNVLAPVSVLSLFVTGLGCTRSMYVQRADKDAYSAIAGKTELLPGEFPLRDGANITPYPDSRLFDVFDPENPPMPPDDPSSHQLMLRVDGRKGAASWNQPGEKASVDSSAWRNLLKTNPRGVVELDLKGAVRLALHNARDFQKEKEDLYLSALDVTFERYQHAPKFALGVGGKEQADGKYKSGVSETSESHQQTSIITDGSVRWITATGGELLASFANSFVWDFKGQTVTDTAGTLVNLSLVQPLLRLGGKDRALESLTQSERTLLANIRQMQQFQMGFFVRIASGRNSGEGPSRNGIVGASGLGVIAGTPGGRTGAPAAGGFMGLLEETKRIENLESNVARLRQSLDQLSAAFDAGRLSSRLQVDQARLALFNSQSSLLSAKAGFKTRLDAYKVDLGLPPDVPLDVRDPLLARFSVSDPEITALDRRLNSIQNRLRDKSQVKAQDDLAALLSELVGLDGAFRSLLERSGRDMESLRKEIPSRKRHLESLARTEAASELGIEPSVLSVQALEERLNTYSRRTGQNAEELQRLAERARKFPETAAFHEPDTGRAELVDLAADFSGLLLAVSLNQTATRLEAASLPAVKITEAEALDIAREHRLDWMNARARLVDSWRKIGYHANALKSGLDFTAAGGIGTLNNNAAKFDGRTGYLNAGLRFDTPLSRLAERNTYREALIEYQQARREYMLFEDRVSQSLRNTLRLVELSQLNFELRRAAVQVAISQVDLARLRLEEPPKPGVIAQIGATTARDLVTALSDLLDAQNDFLSMRVGYEVLRLVLDFESGTMKVKEDGMWDDPGPITPARLSTRLVRWNSRGQQKTEPSTPNLRLSFRQAPPAVR